MADDVTVPLTGSGDATALIRTDDVGGVQYPVSKLDAGGNGVSVPVIAGVQTTANSLPVAIASDQSAIPVSGTVAITSATLATAAKQDTGNTSLASIDGKITAVNTGAVVVSSSALPTLAATSTKQSDGTQKTQIVDGSGNVIAATSNALNVAVTAGSSVIGHVIVDSGTLTTVSAVTAISNALPAGSNVIGHVIADTGSTTAVTGNVTVVQPTGTSLHAVLDTTSTTAVTQVTAASLNATVIGAGTAGTANVGVVTVQGIASMTKLLVTPDANSAVNIAQINGVTPLMGAGNTGTGSPRVTIATDDINLAAINAVAGTTAGAAVVTDANGTLQQYLRGIVKLLITSGTIILGTGANLIGYVGQKNSYTNLTNLTTTNFSGLTTTNAWQSVAIDSAGARDIHFEFQTVGAAGSTLLVDFYIAETLSNGTVYTDGATGTEGTFIAANRKNSRYLGSLQCNGTAAVQVCMKLSDIFGVIPKKFAIIAINNSGGTISATGGNTVFDWAPVN